MAILDSAHNFLVYVVEIAILLFDSMGIVVLVLAGVKGIWGYITKHPFTRLNLAKGMAMALEFKLGGEILRTVTLRDLSELLVVGGLIILRAALAFLIHWEIHQEENSNGHGENIKKQEDSKP